MRIPLRTAVLLPLITLASACSDATGPSTTKFQWDIISVGSGHTCGISAADGKAYCWGGGLIGVGGNYISSIKEGKFTVLGGLTFASISAGTSNTCGVTADGVGYCWGSNEYGQLGNPSTDLTVSCGGMTSRVPCSIFPVPVEGGLLFRTITPATKHVCGLTRDGVAYCWGQGWFGAGHPQEIALVPVLVADSLRFESLVSRSNLICGVTPDGEAYCWDSIAYDQIVAGDRDNAAVVPVKVAGISAVSMITIGAQHTCGLAEGEVYCWGLNTYGQLGVTEGLEECGYYGDVPCRTTPTAVPLPDRAVGVSAGNHHTCAWTHDGRAYCWGANDSGQLGNGSVDDGTATPSAVAGGIAFRSLSLGGSRTCGVASDGAGYCWGYNGVDRGLGNNLFEENVSSVPILVLAPAEEPEET